MQLGPRWPFLFLQLFFFLFAGDAGCNRRPLFFASISNLRLQSAYFPKSPERARKGPETNLKLQLTPIRVSAFCGWKRFLRVREYPEPLSGSRSGLQGAWERIPIAGKYSFPRRNAGGGIPALGENSNLILRSQGNAIRGWKRYWISGKNSLSLQNKDTLHGEPYGSSRNMMKGVLCPGDVSASCISHFFSNLRLQSNEKAIPG